MALNFFGNSTVFYFVSGVTEEELLNKGVISPDDVLRLTKITESKYLVEIKSSLNNI